MGPYVLRSINGHFKLWDEGVQDSFEENLRQAPVNAVPPINTNCLCTMYSTGCGSSLAGVQCGSNQKEHYWTCNLQGCYVPPSQCINDPSCCAAPGKENKCGNSPIPPNGVPPGGPCPTGWPTNISCIPPPANDPDNCYYGEEIWGYQCGNNYSIECVQDSGCRMPECIGSIQFPLSTYSCNTNSQIPLNYSPLGLSQDTPITYVDYPNLADCQNGCSTTCNGSTDPKCLQTCQSNCNTLQYCNTTPGLCNVYCASPSIKVGQACGIQFTVASVPQNTKNAQQTLTHNDTSANSFCASSTTVITSVTASATGQPVPPSVTDSNGNILTPVGDGCQNPGEPTQTCNVNIN